MDDAGFREETLGEETERETERDRDINRQADRHRDKQRQAVDQRHIDAAGTNGRDSCGLWLHEIRDRRDKADSLSVVS